MTVKKLLFSRNTCASNLENMEQYEPAGAHGQLQRASFSLCLLMKCIQAFPPADIHEKAAHTASCTVTMLISITLEKYFQVKLKVTVLSFFSFGSVLSIQVMFFFFLHASCPLPFTHCSAAQSTLVSCFELVPSSLSFCLFSCRKKCLKW